MGGPLTIDALARACNIKDVRCVSLGTATLGRNRMHEPLGHLPKLAHRPEAQSRHMYNQDSTSVGIGPPGGVQVAGGAQLRDANSSYALPSPRPPQQMLRCVAMRCAAVICCAAVRRGAMRRGPRAVAAIAPLDVAPIREALGPSGIAE